MTQMIIWLKVALVLNGYSCNVVAANVLIATDSSAVIQLPEGVLTVQIAHVFVPDSGNVDSAIGLVSDAGFLDLR